MSSSGRQPAGGPATGTVLERRLGRIPLPVRMLVYGVFFLGVVLVVLPWLAYRVDVRWPNARVELGPLRAVGAVVFFACLAVYLHASYLLSSRGRGAYVEFDPPREFVAVGPYRWVRNPIAASLVGTILGEAIAFSSTGIFLLFLLSIVLAHVQVVWVEEPLLRKRFGKSYADYLASVPRWIPRRPQRPAP